MLDLNTKEKVAIGVLSAIAVACFGTAFVLNNKAKKLEEERFQSSLKRAQDHLYIVITALKVGDRKWGKLSHNERIDLVNTEMNEYLEAIEVYIKKDVMKRLTNELEKLIKAETLKDE